jgi:methylthioribose-1-phosphate isomerase
MSEFSPLKYENNKLIMIDQRKLPLEEIWLSYDNVEDIADSIKTMVVRGAPAIGCAAAFGFFIGVRNFIKNKNGNLNSEIKKIVRMLGETRPTAVNLFGALRDMESVVISENRDLYLENLEKTALKIWMDDVKSCKQIGKNGIEVFPEGKLNVLTHCNAGALATGGYGTALGVIRALHENNRLNMVYADDTRPRQQGAKLTVWELTKDNIPVTLVPDTAAGLIMSKKMIDLVVTGADRIAQNGDSANKIGTYNIAIIAKRHNIPFYIAAPLTTYDPETLTGEGIPIEERDGDEVRKVGDTYTTVPSVKVFNPGFDVTPAELIKCIITEKGNIFPPYKENFKKIL